jgi:tetratricopeptide (TPR) repeat protein
MTFKSAPRPAIARAGAVSRLSLLLMTCAVLVACRVSPTGTLIGPSIGAQPWWIAESAHFTVRADLGQTETREIAIDLERAYRLLSELAFPLEKEPNLHTDVIVFREKEGYQRVGPNATAGFFRPVGFESLDGGTFMTFGGISDAARRIFVHELTHRFVRHVCPQAPVWLNEGLAKYYEMITVEGGKAVLGRSPYVFRRGDSWDKRRGGIPVGALPSWSELTGMDAAAFYAARSMADGDESEEATAARDKQHASYASAWATVHLLQNHPEHYGDRLHQWLAKMAAGTLADEAYRQAFGDMSMDLLEKDRADLLEKLITGDYMVLRTDYDNTRPARVTDHAVSPAEQDVLLARLDLMGRGAPTGAARALVDAALEKDPSLVEARLLSARLFLGDGNLAEAERELSAAAAAAPNSENVAYAQFRFYSSTRKGLANTAARRAKVDAIVEKWVGIARSPTVLNDFAWYMALHGRAEAAVPIAKRSIELDPSCAACFDTLAVALFRSGEMKAAVSAQEMSVALLREDQSDERLVRRLSLFRKAWAAVVIWKKHPAPDQDPALLPLAVISAIQEAQRPHVWDCYVEGRKQNPKLAGAVLVRVEIGADGKVTSAAPVPASSWDTLPQKPSAPPLPDEGVGLCAAEQLGSVRFPASSRPTNITSPLVFAPNKSSTAP